MGAVIGVVTVGAGLIAATSPVAAATAAEVGFHTVNLVSDQPGAALTTDANLVNAWGMAHGPNSPLWVSDNGTDVSTLYTATPGGASLSTVPLVVATPGGAPTGQIFNDTRGFVVPGTGQPATFVFAGENGDLTAWNAAALPITSAVSVGHVSDGVLKGLALVHSPFGPLLLGADFHHNSIVVWDSTFTRLAVAGLFQDHAIPRGYAPFNVAEFGDRVYVTYAEQDADAHDDTAGPGHGFVDVFTNYGTLVKRLVSRGALNSPWGMVIAPRTFGAFADALLVGNFGDGRINAYDRHSGRLLGTLHDGSGQNLVIDGLWGLIRGDKVAAGSNAVWFSAGPDGESHGLLGLVLPD